MVHHHAHPAHGTPQGSPGHAHAAPGDVGTDHGGHVPGKRLNLLLSWGGWRPDSWADRMATLLEPMGVTSLKARTARQAEEVIRRIPIHIAVVDLGLPLDYSHPSAEAGARLLQLLRRLECPPPTVIVRSPRPQRDACRDMSAALRSDAFAIVDRRSADVELMLKVLQRALERFYQGRWPGCPHHTPPSGL